MLLASTMPSTIATSYDTAGGGATRGRVQSKFDVGGPVEGDELDYLEEEEDEEDLDVDTLVAMGRKLTLRA